MEMQLRQMFSLTKFVGKSKQFAPRVEHSVIPMISGENWSISLSPHETLISHSIPLLRGSYHSMMKIIAISQEMTPYFPAKIGHLLSCFDLNFEKGDLTLCAEV